MSAVRQFLRRTPVAYAYYAWKFWGEGNAQSDEPEIIDRLAAETGAPSSFVEFGFAPGEFNCIRLSHHADGLLIDCSERSVEIANAILPKRVRARQMFLTLDNLDVVRNAFPKLGVLSIDVDGNDYWFLKALIELEPSIISVEYNSSFCQESVTIPYAPDFDRSIYSPDYYHGASLIALAKLCRAHGYGLAAVSRFGANAFFTTTGDLDPVAAWRPNALRMQWNGGKTDAENFAAMAGLPFVAV